jgi:hypothetical protein
LKVVIVPEVEVRVVIEPFTEVSVLILAIFEVKESPVAFVKPKVVAKRFVEVVFVPVAFTQVMFVRLSGEPSTKFVMVAVVAVRLAIVEEVKVAEGENRFVTVPEVEVKLLMVPASARKFVTKRLVPVALANRKFVMVPEEALKVVTPSVSMKALVADKFVVVTLLAVTSPNAAFQRLVSVPRVKARSAAGTRSEFTKFVTAKLVVVPFVIVVFWREVVPVAVRSETVSPPKSVTEEVAKLPRLVTEARVSLSSRSRRTANTILETDGLARDRRGGEGGDVGLKRRSRGVVGRERTRDRGRSCKEVGGRNRDGRQGSDGAIGRNKGIDRAIGSREKRDEEEEPVAFKKETFWRLLSPFAVKTPLTVALVLKTKSAVEVPPANWMAVRRRVAGIRDGLEIRRGSGRTVGAACETDRNPIHEHGG